MMKLNLETFSGISQPIYILEEARLRRNLNLIANVAREADVEIILAFKAYALWKTFPSAQEETSPNSRSDGDHLELSCP